MKFIISLVFFLTGTLFAQSIGCAIDEMNLRIDELSTKLKKSCSPYIYNLKEEEIKKRFKSIEQVRWNVYFTNPEDYGKKGAIGFFKSAYKTPNDWEKYRSRYPFPMSFEYNLAVPYYSANILVIDEVKFIAIEAPSEKNKEKFLEIIKSYDIGQIVRLNKPDEYPDESYYFYWEDPLLLDIQNVVLEWPHRDGINPQALLKTVETVFNQQKMLSSKFIGVSCRAGAGRSGTFIVAYALYNKIRKEMPPAKKKEDIKLNIDELFLEASIQRPFAISHQSQYISRFTVLWTWLLKNYSRNYLN